MPLEELFENTHNLPNIPKIVQELIENFNNPDVNADDISKKIQMDQVISAKVMRLANSARYGAGRTIPSIDSAVVYLGFDTLKTLVVASGVTGAFKDIPGFDKKQFWKDTFMIASISKLIAKHTSEDPEIAFTCGMLHSIGDLLIHITKVEPSFKIDELVASGANKIDLQQNQFGYDYTQVGEELTKRWNFPEEIQMAVRQHGNPDKFEEFSPLSAIVNIAMYLNTAFNRDKEKEEILGNFPSQFNDKLNIDLLSLFDELLTLVEADDDIDQLLS